VTRVIYGPGDQDRNRDSEYAAALHPLLEASIANLPKFSSYEDLGAEEVPLSAFTQSPDSLSIDIAREVSRTWRD